MGHSFNHHFGKRHCTNMMLNVDFQQSDTSKVTRAGGVWERFQNFVQFIASRNKRNERSLCHILNTGWITQLRIQFCRTCWINVRFQKAQLIWNINTQIAGRIVRTGRLAAKSSKSFLKTKKKGQQLKHGKKHDRSKWKHAANDKILYKRATVSNAIRGITAKFPRPFTGPYIVHKLIPSNTYELMYGKGRVMGQFILKSFKAYNQATHSPSWVSEDRKTFEREI